MQKLPSYCRHKAKGLAYVTLHGQVKYLGKFGTEESIRRYERVIAEFLSGQDRDDVATVVELCADYLSWAVKYYVKNGKQTSEVWIIKSVIKKLRGLYGSLDVIDLRPKHLKALQQAWIVDGICRSEVNRRVGHVKRLVRWGVREEIVPPEILTALTTVPGLKRGRSGARETTPVGPVDLRGTLSLHVASCVQQWPIWCTCSYCWAAGPVSCCRCGRKISTGRVARGCTYPASTRRNTGGGGVKSGSAHEHSGFSLSICSAGASVSRTASARTGSTSIVHAVGQASRPGDRTDCGTVGRPASANGTTLSTHVPR
jgi:hypothetical protein